MRFSKNKRLNSVELAPKAADVSLRVAETADRVLASELATEVQQD